MNNIQQHDALSTHIVCQWCGSDAMHIRKSNVKPINAQLDVPHTLYGCATCGGVTLVALWRNQDYVYRAFVRRRFLLPPLAIIIYQVACAWCGDATTLDPEDINATVANPAHARHRYDIYRCSACQRCTAVAYVGTTQTYPATQDTRYHTLYTLVDDG